MLYVKHPSEDIKTLYTSNYTDTLFSLTAFIFIAVAIGRLYLDYPDLPNLPSLPGWLGGLVFAPVPFFMMLSYPIAWYCLLATIRLQIDHRAGTVSWDSVDIPLRVYATRDLSTLRCVRRRRWWIGPFPRWAVLEFEDANLPIGIGSPYSQRRRDAIAREIADFAGVPFQEA